MTKFSDNDSPSLLFTEQGSTPTSPAASHDRLFVRSSDHLLCLVNSSGTVTAVGSGGLSDPMTTRGDMIIRNASNVTARLGRGSANQVLTSDGTDIAWATPASGGLAQSFYGYNTAGASWETLTTNRVYCKKFTLAASGNLISVDIYLRPSTDNLAGLNAMIMADNSNAPGVLLGGNLSAGASAGYLSNSSSMPGAGRWYSIPVTSQLAAGDYWVAFSSEGTRYDVAYDGSGSDQYFTSSGWYVTGAYPTAWAITTGTRKYSIRASVLA